MTEEKREPPKFEFTRREEALSRDLSGMTLRGASKATAGALGMVDRLGYLDIAILHARARRLARPFHVLFVGPSGVGKNAIAEMAAHGTV